MNMPEPDLRTLHGLLYRHQWTDVAEWGRALAALADLSEPEIDRLVRTGSEDPRLRAGVPSTTATVSG